MSSLAWNKVRKLARFTKLLTCVFWLLVKKVAFHKVHLHIRASENFQGCKNLGKILTAQAI